MLHKYKVIFMVIIVLAYSISPKIALLSFCIFFQIGSIIEIINQVKISKRIGKGRYAKGYISEIRAIPGSEEDVHNYECVIKFTVPNKIDSYFVKYKFSSLTKPDISKQYKIWINEENPNNSIVLDAFGIHWKFSIAIFCLIALSLLFIEMVLLTDIYSVSSKK